MRRRVLRALIAALMALPIVGVGSPASAATVDLVCPGTLRIDFSPGLTLAPGPQQITGQAIAGTSLSPATPCSSVLSGTPYTGGSGPISGTGNVGCLSVGSLTGTAQGTVAFTWNNGDTSTFAWQAILGAPIPIVSGSIVSGALVGTTILALGVIPTGLTGNCVLAPLKSVGVLGLALFVQL
jgi:hypothetical protein